MKIALIKCATTAAPLESVYGDVFARFASLFSKNGMKIEFERYDAVAGQLPVADLNVDGFLFSGSAASAYETDEWIVETKRFIRNTYRQQKKLVGICFGHQIIAEALGGKVTRSQKGWGIGVQTAFIKKQMDWMDPAVKACNIIVSHRDQIQTLPPNAMLLGSTAHCRYFLFSVGRTVLGIQGHPEMEKEFAAALYRMRVDSIGQKAVDDALTSLQEPIDSAIWADWIIHFLIHF